MVVPLQNEPAFCSAATHDREMVSGPGDAHRGRLTCGDRRTYCHWHQGTSGRICTNDGTRLISGLVFRSSHRGSFHAWIAASSPCEALWIGLCGRSLLARRRQLP
jgi:hypothetical protein